MVFDPSCAPGGLGGSVPRPFAAKIRISGISGDRDEQEKHHFLIVLLSF